MGRNIRKDNERVRFNLTLSEDCRQQLEEVVAYLDADSLQEGVRRSIRAVHAALVKKEADQFLAELGIVATGSVRRREHVGAEPERKSKNSGR